MNIIEILQYKEKPFCYLDTHAGRGVYALPFHSIPSHKEDLISHECATGIEKIMAMEIGEMPFLVKKYLNLVKQWGYPKYYPGSPGIAKTLLRKSDCLILTELQIEEFKCLKENFKKIKNIAIHHLDGYKGLKSFLPPKERRGFILIDPPFEQLNEWHAIVENLKEGIKKFPSGIYAIWYPIKEIKKVEMFLNSIDALKLENILTVELTIHPKDVSLQLVGCGMLIINPPWSLKKEIGCWLPWVWQKLAINGAGSYRVHIG
jgi:23S rRNA (adenine2030-N6)-methyltransferase